jgi:hypothetical protein
MVMELEVVVQEEEVKMQHLIPVVQEELVILGL